MCVAAYNNACFTLANVSPPAMLHVYVAQGHFSAKNGLLRALMLLHFCMLQQQNIKSGIELLIMTLLMMTPMTLMLTLLKC